MATEYRASKEQAYFAASNSRDGFHSYYEQCFRHKVDRLLYIKGGPGTGKSTLRRGAIGQSIITAPRTRIRSMLSCCTASREASAFWTRPHRMRWSRRYPAWRKNGSISGGFGMRMHLPRGVRRSYNSISKNRMAIVRRIAILRARARSRTCCGMRSCHVLT